MSHRRDSGRRPPPTPPKVKRAPPTLDAHVTLWVFCEGEQTEPGWLMHLHQASCRLNLRIAWTGAVGVPRTLWERAKGKLVELKKGRRTVASDDEVWIIFDRDNFPRNKITEAWAGALRDGLGVVFSNECFELWPLLHYEFRAAPTGRKELQRALEQHDCTYDHDDGATVAWPKIDAATSEAVERAIRLHLRDPVDLVPNPSTSAWLLQQRCLHALDHEARWFIEILGRHPELAPLAHLLAEPTRSRALRTLGPIAHPPPPG